MIRSIVCGVMVVCLLVSCQTKTEPALSAGIDECRVCSMVIDKIDHGAVILDSEENLQTYCNPVCLINDINKGKIRGPKIDGAIFLFDYDDLTPIAASRASIVHGDFPTTMGHGLLAFKDRHAADNFAGEVSGAVIDWNRLRARHELPDTRIDLDVNDTDDPPILEVQRGEVIEVFYRNDSPNEVTISLTGYEFEMPISADAEESGRFVASRPGSGFVFKNNDASILAKLLVLGDHTAEEAIYR